MTSNNIIPATYEQWRHCIEVRCKVPLTANYISERLTELEDGANPKTKNFAELYGADYLQQVIVWFRQASEAPAS